MINETKNGFIELLYTWEQYEIVLKPFVTQKIVLIEESKILEKILDETLTSYNKYLNKFKINKIVESERAILKDKLWSTLKEVLNFLAALNDVNFNIQNYVFGNFLNDKIYYRTSTGSGYYTISELIKKHEKVIYKRIGPQTPKKFFKRIKYYINNFKNW